MVQVATINAAVVKGLRKVFEMPLANGFVTSFWLLGRIVAVGVVLDFCPFDSATSDSFFVIDLTEPCESSIGGLCFLRQTFFVGEV